MCKRWARGVLCAPVRSCLFLAPPSPVRTTSIQEQDDWIPEHSAFFCLPLTGACCSFPQLLSTKAQNPRPDSSGWGHSSTMQSMRGHLRPCLGRRAYTVWADTKYSGVPTLHTTCFFIHSLMFSTSMSNTTFPALCKTQGV